MKTLDEAIKDIEYNKMNLDLSSAADNQQIVDWLKELKEYKELETQNKLLKLPCKRGDTIYIVRKYGNYVEEAYIVGISEADDIDCFCYKIYIDPDYYNLIELKEYNKSWFLTKTEAETALKAYEGQCDDGHQEKIALYYCEK